MTPPIKGERPGDRLRNVGRRPMARRRYPQPGPVVVNERLRTVGQLLLGAWILWWVLVAAVLIAGLR